jgi:gentisate 1,2-dioxygenase
MEMDINNNDTTTSDLYSYIFLVKPFRVSYFIVAASHTHSDAALRCILKAERAKAKLKRKRKRLHSAKYSM